MTRQTRGDEAGARAAYERAITHDARSGVAANNLAWLYAELGRSDEALVLAQRATAALHNAPQALDTLGWVHHLAGRSDEAIRAFQEALAKRPDNPAYHYHLGAAYLRAGRMDDARASLQQALHLSSSFDGVETARKMLSDMH